MEAPNIRRRGGDRVSRARGSRAAPKTGNAFPERAAFYCNVIKESLALLAAGLLAVVGALWLSRPSPLSPRARVYVFLLYIGGRAFIPL